MSCTASSWAYRQPISNQSAKAVLVALSDHVNDDGDAFPGHNWLCLKTSSSLATVKRALRLLKDEGYLSATSREDANGRQTTNLYSVDIFDEQISKRIPQWLEFIDKFGHMPQWKRDTYLTAMEQKVRGVTVNPSQEKPKNDQESGGSYPQSVNRDQGGGGQSEPLGGVTVNPSGGSHRPPLNHKINNKINNELIGDFFDQNKSGEKAKAVEQDVGVENSNDKQHELELSENNRHIPKTVSDWLDIFERLNYDPKIIRSQKSISTLYQWIGYKVNIGEVIIANQESIKKLNGNNPISPTFLRYAISKNRKPGKPQTKPKTKLVGESLELWQKHPLKFATEEEYDKYMSNEAAEKLKAMSELTESRRANCTSTCL